MKKLEDEKDLQSKDCEDNLQLNLDNQNEDDDNTTFFVASFNNGKPQIQKEKRARQSMPQLQQNVEEKPNSQAIHADANKIEEILQQSQSSTKESIKTLEEVRAEREARKSKIDWMDIKWDYILAGLLVVATLFMLFALYRLDLLSFSWMWKISLLFVVFDALFILWIFFKGLKSWVIWTRRIIILILTFIFAGGGTFITVFSDNFYNALEAITNPETTTTVNVSLVSKKARHIKDIEDLSGKKIGIQTATDKSNSEYVKEQLDKEKKLKDVKYVEGLDYDFLYKQLLDEKIDALIITDSYINTILKDHYPDIHDQIFKIKSYQKRRESTLNTTNKDIRYNPFTIYIAGVDEGDDTSIDARSDVNILLLVNPLINKVTVVSVPRDSFVPNPALGNQSDKLTHLGLNGVENSMKGLEQVFGVPIDFYVKLNFFSVIDIIGAIGTIQVDVPIDFCEQDEYRSFAEKDLICLKAGIQRVNGKQALAFARHRKSYTDIMRGKAQQEVIKGIINELTTPAGAAKVNNILKVAPKSITTNMPMEQVKNFVSMQLDHLKPWTIDSIVLENGSNASLVTASMPGLPLSVILLNQLDADMVYQAYKNTEGQMQMNDFSFHLDQLEHSDTALHNNPNMVWSGSNTSRYETPLYQEPIQDEGDSSHENSNVIEKPVQPPTPNPSEPVEPPVTKPEEPEKPKPPTDTDQPKPEVPKPEEPEKPKPEVPEKPKPDPEKPVDPNPSKPEPSNF